MFKYISKTMKILTPAKTLKAKDSSIIDLRVPPYNRKFISFSNKTNPIY